MAITYYMLQIPPLMFFVLITGFGALLAVLNETQGDSVYVPAQIISEQLKMKLLKRLKFRMNGQNSN